MDISRIFDLINDAFSKNDNESEPAPEWVKATKKACHMPTKRIFSKRLYRPP